MYSFELPIDRPVYFQAIDGKGMAIQSMRSATYVHAGETLMCQGCHAPRHRAVSAARYPLAMRRAPSSILPEAEGSKPFSYPIFVQPVLDKHCADCHAEEPDLTRGDIARNNGSFFPSYMNLQKHAFFFSNAVFTTPMTIPGKFGARASGLYHILTRGHHDVKLSPEELHRITLWLDCNSDFFGCYENLAAQVQGKVVQPTLE